MDPRQPVYLPTPAEIAQACAEIRAGWSEEEHRVRAHAGSLERVAELATWQPPIVHVELDTSDLHEAGALS